MIGYDLVQYRGEFYSDGTPKLITKRIEQALAKLEEALDYAPGTLDLPQGCHHNGVLSGGTHSRADVFDISYEHAIEKATAGLALGVVVFIRDYDWDHQGGMAHCHCLLAGSENFSAEAAAQIPDWRDHKDGLADHGPYDPDYPWKGDIADFGYDPHWTRDGGTQGQGKLNPDALAAQLAIGMHHAAGTRVVAALDKVTKAHPEWGEWATLEADFKTDVQAPTTKLHTRAVHLAHQGDRP